MIFLAVMNWILYLAFVPIAFAAVYGENKTTVKISLWVFLILIFCTMICNLFEARYLLY